MSQPNFTPEVFELDRTHIQNLINQNMTTDEINDFLIDAGYDRETVNKIISDLGSYSKPSDTKDDEVE